jgi:spermidine dehydrogenase
MWTQVATIDDNVKKSDRKLGMDQPITRRDVLHGVSALATTSLLPGSLLADTINKLPDIGGSHHYPPALTGMRGSHPGSFEVAHQLAREGKREWGSAETHESDTYDLVVVGAGISGLSAAYFFRKENPGARVLVLDNHDDFGGHAKRNEFEIDGRLMIGYGGTMLIEAPAGYPAVARQLIEEIGIDTQRFYSAYHHDLYDSFGLESGVFFSRERFGTDHLAAGPLSDPEILSKVPLSAKGKADLGRLFTDDRHYLGDMSGAERIEYLVNTDYATYLRERAGIGEEALKVLEPVSMGVWAIGIDALPAKTAWSSGYPGFGDLEIDLFAYDRSENNEPYIFHFPDGNATVARLLVRKMIPGAAPGNDMEDIVTARFDYDELDSPKSPVRVRLNSTVVQARHVDRGRTGPVDVTYVRENKAHRVRAANVILACNHSIIPSLCPEMPQTQRAALSNALRAPLTYTNVLVRNWRSFVESGVHRVSWPGGFFNRIMLDYPVSLGNYKCPTSPEEPIVVHMNWTPGQPGLSAREQFIAGRRDLLATPFEVFERNVREQMDRLLGGAGFDPAKDIAGITVNRWPHGYAYGYDPETDRVAFEPDDWPPEMRHWERASEPFGNITIAATDAASNAMTESAIEEAYRAVAELGRES